MIISCSCIIEFIKLYDNVNELNDHTSLKMYTKLSDAEAETIKGVINNTC